MIPVVMMTIELELEERLDDMKGRCHMLLLLLYLGNFVSVFACLGEYFGLWEGFPFRMHFGTEDVISAGLDC